MLGSMGRTPDNPQRCQMPTPQPSRQQQQWFSPVPRCITPPCPLSSRVGQAAGEVGGDEVAELLVAHLGARVAVH